MKSINLKKEYPLWLVLLLPYLFGIAMWNQLPASVPIHFDFSGKPDRFADKGLAVLGLPLVNILLYFYFLFTSGDNRSIPGWITRLIIHCVISSLLIGSAVYGMSLHD